jgi:hypothetical protein
MVRAHPWIHIFTATLCERMDNRAIWPYTAESRGCSWTRLVANAFSAPLPARRIRLPGLTRGFREHAFASSSSLSDAPLTKTSSNSELFNLIRSLRGSTNWCENGIWLSCRTMRNLLLRSPNRSILFGLMITHLRRGDTPSWVRIDWSKDGRTIGRMPGVFNPIRPAVQT